MAFPFIYGDWGMVYSCFTYIKQNFLLDYGDFGAAPLATCHGPRYLRELAKQPWAPAAAEWKILQTLWCEGLLKVFFPTPEDGSLEKTHAATAGCYRLIEMRGEEMSPLVKSSLFFRGCKAVNHESLVSLL